MTNKLFKNQVPIMRNLVILLILCFGITFPASARRPDIVKDFREHYSGIKTMLIRFKDPTGMVGTLKAERGGKFRLELDSMEIISDGRTVLNISHSARTAVHNNLAEAAGNTRMDQIFFYILNVYETTLLRKPEKNQPAILRLLPPSGSVKALGIEYVDLEVDFNLKVGSLVVFDGYQKVRWQILELKTNPSFHTTQFITFQPKGYEYIDLRDSD